MCTFQCSFVRNQNNNFLFKYFSGAIFEQGTDEVQSAFKFAMLNHNLNVSGRRFELQAYVDVINTADAFKLSRLSEYSYEFVIYNDGNFSFEVSPYLCFI